MRHSRYLSQTLTVAACIMFLSACGKQKEAHLVLLTTGGASRNAAEAALEEFYAENPGVNVQVVTTPAKDYYVKSLTMLAGGAQVDLLWQGQGFGIFAGRNTLVDLMPFIEKDPDFRLEDYNQTVVDWYRYKEKLYGIPFGVNVLAIAYNQDLFDAAGLPYPQADWTLDDMLLCAEKLTRFDPETGRARVAGLGFRELGHRYYGLSLLSEDQRHFMLNNEQGRKWMLRNLDLIYNKRILQRGSDMESIDRLTGFFSEQVAIIDVSTWDIRELRRNAHFRWDIAAIPLGEGGKRRVWASSAGFCIPRSSKQPELAWKLLKKLSGKNFQRKMMDTNIPTLNALIPEYLESNPKPPESLGELVRMIDYMQPDPRISAFQEVKSEWNYWRERAFLREISVETALKKAESKINRILDLHHERVLQ
ncbi:MAG: ABC transporter substrate-binding protein [Chthoniobacterales bacterium]